MTTQAEVIIVGAGIAAAAAALRLSEHGIKSLVLEAQQRIGGRVQTVHLAENVDIDFGASYVHGYQRSEDNPTRKMAEKLGITLRVPQPSPGYVFGTSNDKRPLDADYLKSIQTKIGEVMSEKAAEKGDLSLSGRVLEDLRKIAPEAEPLARVAELGAGIQFEDISARFWKTERGFVGVDAIPDGGYLALVRAAFEKAQADVQLGKEVTKVEQQANGIKLSTLDGDSYSAPHVIITIPIAVLQTGRVAFNPELPQERQRLLNRVSVGLLDKFSLLYDSVWWPADAGNFILLPTSSKLDKFDANTPVEEVLESSSIMVANMHVLSQQKPALLLVYLPPHAAEVLENYSDSKLTPAMHSHVLSRLQHVATGEPIAPRQGKMVRWKADKFALGATTSPIALGKDAQPEDLDLLGESLWQGTLGFAGEGTDRHLRGSVVGAVASGEREAERLVKALRK